jgi:hypothetical protein
VAQCWRTVPGRLFAQDAELAVLRAGRAAADEALALHTACLGGIPQASAPSFQPFVSLNLHERGCLYMEGGREGGTEGASERGREGGTRREPAEREGEGRAQVLAQASEIVEAEIASRSSKRAAQRLLATGAFARGGAGARIDLSGNQPKCALSLVGTGLSGNGWRMLCNRRSSRTARGTCWHAMRSLEQWTPSRTAATTARAWDPSRRARACTVHGVAWASRAVRARCCMLVRNHYDNFIIRCIINAARCAGLPVVLAAATAAGDALKLVADAR